MSSTDSGSRSGFSRKQVRQIATRQREIIFLILIQIILYALQFAMPEEWRLAFVLPLLIVGLGSAIVVFLLAILLYGTGIGILLGVFALIPLIGLIVLLIVNGKATSILRENGIEVGLLGAKGKIE